MAVSPAAGYNEALPAVSPSLSPELTVVSAPESITRDIAYASMPTGMPKILKALFDKRLLSAPDTPGMSQLSPLGSAYVKCELLAGIEEMQRCGAPPEPYDVLTHHGSLYRRLELIKVERTDGSPYIGTVNLQDIIHFGRVRRNGGLNRVPMQVKDISSFRPTYDPRKDPESTPGQRLLHWLADRVFDH